MPELRLAEPDDLPFLRTMLYEAAFWRPGRTRPPLERALAEPRLARYLEGWRRPDDFGVVAVDAAKPIGATWARSFTAGAPGYGFVDETVPEVSLAVDPGHRGRGVGTALLRELLHQARDRGLARLSLSVERDNPSRRLYERLGFETIDPAADAWTMAIELDPAR
jgi:ribosomal protein S18 acetylase RimI-like enzyme